MKLQFITHYTDTYSYYDSARMALEGGCRWIQLRMKDASSEELEQEALRIQALCRQYNATFIIDDHVELVKKLHAHGVHLGKNDMPIAEARKFLGPDFIIGGTANTFDDVRRHLYRWSQLHWPRSVSVYYNQKKPQSHSRLRRLP